MGETGGAPERNGRIGQNTGILPMGTAGWGREDSVEKAGRIVRGRLTSRRKQYTVRILSLMVKKLLEIVGSVVEGQKKAVLY